MIQYILECMAFQLLFLIVYDLFLKKETFFQWNRVYLLGSFVLSILMPWIKIEALKTTVSKESFVYPEYLWGMDMSSGFVGAAKPTASFHLTTTEMVLYGGMSIAAGLFFFKLYQIFLLKKRGEIQYFQNFTRVMVRNSQMAFSFFRSIFIGDQVLKKDQESIIQHELVHIEQRHSLDLLFFELMRIIGWFNPLVYVYQNRVSELHEFIADAKVAKIHKSAQYQLLLSQVFQTQNISFINHFYKSSLIKKRIVMLQKSESKHIWRLKYLLMLPLVVGMLVYTSTEAKEKDKVTQEQTMDDAALIKILEAKIQNEIKDKGSANAVLSSFIRRGGVYKDSLFVSKEYFFERMLFMRTYYAETYNNNNNRMNDNIWDVASTMSEPSTALYEIYVQRKKAFQLLDKNLKASIAAYNSDVVLLDALDSNNQENYVFVVKNIKNVTGNELRAINSKLEEIFERGEGYYKNLILTDRLYDFLVFDPKKSKNSLIPKENNEVNGSNILSLNQDPIDIPFSVVEKVPVFPGCEDVGDKRACFNAMMQKHISENFKYPEEAQQKGIEGRVNIMFVIQVDGSIGNVRMRSPDKLLEEEAARIISLLPKMTPAEHKGEKVRIPYSIPITFKLQRDNNLDLIDGPSTYNMTAKYNELLKERRRLLENSEENNPVIVNLDQQIKALRNKIDTNEVDIPFAVIDQVPVFPGCENAKDKRVCFSEMMQKHISKNFRYPEEAQMKGIQGRVNIMFIIQEDGSIGNLRMRGPDKLLEDEAARIISLLPSLTPGEHKGKKVRVPFSIPITFKLEGEIIEKTLQTKVDVVNNIHIHFSEIDEVPIFPGCENAEDKRVCFNEMIQKHISENFRYPEEAQKKGIQGRVSAMFAIGTDGAIGNVRMRGPDKLLEDEAARIISLLPQMTPGEHKGEKVRVAYFVPITFKLQ